MANFSISACNDAVLRSMLLFCALTAASFGDQPKIEVQSGVLLASMWEGCCWCCCRC